MARLLSEARFRQKKVEDKRRKEWEEPDAIMGFEDETSIR